MKLTGPSTADAYTDVHSLTRSQAGAWERGNQARSQSPEALKQTAQQFEALFLQMTMKNMRQAGEPLAANSVDSNGSRMFRDMHDQQMATQLAKNSNIGFADMLVKQLGGPAANGMPGKSLNEYRHSTARMIPLHKPDGKDLSGKGLTMPPRLAKATRATARYAPSFTDEKSFFQALLPEAKAAAKELGVDPKLLLSQVALETGWGKHTPHRVDGSDSYNMFGIKANSAWQGRRVANSTLEYEQGVPVRKTDYFRAYGSYAESFRDYVGFLRDNPRYADALAQVDNPKQYMTALQKAGYATDPHYSNKVMSIYRQWRDFDASLTNVAAGASKKQAGTEARRVGYGEEA